MNTANEEFSVMSRKHKVFATLLVYIKAKNGGGILLRALLDPVSDSCFITTSAARRIQGTRMKSCMPIAGLGGTLLGTSESSLVLDVMSTHDQSVRVNIDAQIAPKVSGMQPSRPLENCNEWPHLQGLQLADPGFGKPAPIDLLLDVEVYDEIMNSGILRSENIPKLPSARQSSFGWIVLGICRRENESRLESLSSISTMHTSVDLNRQIQQFWNQEELVPEQSEMSEEDAQCQREYDSTISRDPDGRYVVALPFYKESNRGY